MAKRTPVSITPEPDREPDEGDSLLYPEETFQDYVARKNAEEGVSADGRAVNESRRGKWANLEHFDPHMGSD